MKDRSIIYLSTFCKISFHKFTFLKNISNGDCFIMGSSTMHVGSNINELYQSKKKEILISSKLESEHVY